LIALFLVHGHDVHGASSVAGTTAVGGPWQSQHPMHGT
jgi:hypothetical protein